MVDPLTTPPGWDHIERQGPVDPVRILLPKSVTSSLLADGAANPAAVTALPSTPYDGQEVYFVADATNGIIWHLRYREAGVSGKKWEYVGGPPLVVTDNDARATGSTSYTNLPTDPMSLSLPSLGGDYDIEIQAALYNGTAGYNAFLSYAVSGVNSGNASDDWAVNESNTVTEITSAMRTRHTGVTSGGTVAEKARVSGGAGNFARRRILAWPVRLG